VVTADGEPVSKARISLAPSPDAWELARLRLAASDPEPVETAASDGEGLFAIRAPEVEFWTLRVERPGFAARELGLRPLLDAADLAPLELDAGHEVTVRVLGADGEPVAARVRATPKPPPPGTDPFQRRRRSSGPWSVADPMGVAGPEDELRWTLGGEDAWIVEAHAEGYPPRRREVRPATDRRVEMRLEPGVERRVEVVDGHGRPVAGAVISLAEGLLPLAETDARGEATLIVDAGEVSLEVVAPEGRRGSQTLAPLRKTKDATHTEATVITLEDPITVSGRVIEEETRRPIAGALVWAGLLTGRADGDGVYTLTGPRQELRGVSAAAAGYSTGLGMFGDFRGSSPPTGETSSEGPAISLAPTASLRGIVVDSDGAPLRSVEIEIDAKRGPLRRGTVFRPPSISSRSGRTSAQGRFQIHGLLLDSGYQLSFAKDGFAPAKVDIDELGAREDREALRVVLEPGRRGVGWVVDERDAPVAGAEVRLDEAPDAAPRGSRRFFDLDAGQDEPDAVADGEGRFEVVDLAPGRYDLRAEAPGFAPVTVPGVEVLDGPGEIDLGTVVLVPGAAIEGRVVDARGRPVAGAGIRVAQPSGSSMMPSVLRMAAGRPADATSAADGRFRVTDQQPGSRVDLSVEKDGYVTADVAGVEAPSPEPLEVVLRTASKVLGRVVTEDGQPVAGASVQVQPESHGARGFGPGMSGWRQVQSEEDGTFEVADVPPGRVDVAAGAAGYRRLELGGIEVPADEPLRGLELVLVPGAEVRGTVTEADGKPAAGVFVAVTETGSMSFGHDGTMTDADGKYLIAGTAPGMRKVVAMDRASRRTSKNVEIELGTNTVDLVFEGGVEISGQVLDIGGAPVPGAVVRLRPSRTASVPRFGRMEASSGTDGSFTVADVAPGTYDLSAAKEGYAPAELDEPLEIGANPIAGLIVRLDAGTTLTGRVLGLEYDDLARVEIRAMVNGASLAKPDFEGRYRIPNVPAGEVTVMAEVPGSGRQVRAKTTIPEGAPEAVLDLEFGSGFTLTGTVLHDGRPVGGAILTLAGINVSHAANATVSQDGSFRVEGLPEGNFRLSVLDRESGLAHGEEVEITADADVRIDVSTARISGRVRDAIDFSPIEGAAVSATTDDEAAGSMPSFGRVKTVRSDARGYFSFGEVAEGAWKVTAIKSGYGPAEQTVSVQGGSPIEDLDLSMSATEGLSFEVVLASGRPPGLVQAAFLDGAGNRVAGGTFETPGGEAWITTVAAGSWEMLLMAENGAQQRIPVVVPGKLGRIVVPPGGRLQVDVPELREGAVSATLRLSGPDGRPYLFLDFRGNANSELTLRGGMARAGNLASGSWTVQVVASDGRSWSKSVSVAPDAETAVSFP
jgi:Carboxypeptidase regulatory-like domain